MKRYHNKITRVGHEKLAERLRELKSLGCDVTEVTVMTKKRQKRGPVKLVTLAVIKYSAPTKKARQKNKEVFTRRPMPIYPPSKNWAAKGVHA